MIESSNPSAAFLTGAVTFERRADIRYEYDSRSEVPAVREGQENCPVRLLNISAGGLAFLADQCIEPSTLLSVDLPSKDENGTRRIVMRVRSAEAQTLGGWKVGCEFARKLSTFELLALL